MTLKDKLTRAKMLAMRIKSIASSIKSEGDDYDMQWHKSYCKQLIDIAEEVLKL